MIVLGFDTATAATAVGLMLADGSILQARDDPEGERRPGHATRLLPLAEGLLVEAGLGWGELERIAVGVGPGTFTGLRIGVATARALAQSLEVDLVGVSSLRALAYGAGERAAGVLAAIDARRSEVFVAGYVGEQEALAPRAVPPDGMGDLLEHAAIDVTAEQWVALGDGAVRYREAFERLGVSVPADRAECHRIQATAICELGSRLASSSGRPFAHTDAEPPIVPSGSAQIGEKAVVPDYLRRPDAEVALGGVA